MSISKDVAVPSNKFVLVTVGSTKFDELLKQLVRINGFKLVHSWEQGKLMHLTSNFIVGQQSRRTP